MTSLNLGNGLTETRTLDQAYQVDAITVPGILERDYGHTVDANVASIEDQRQSCQVNSNVILEVVRDHSKNQQVIQGELCTY